MKKILLFIMFFSLAAYYAFFWRLPAAAPLELKAIPPVSSTLLIPLDSRPVCTVMPQQLGLLAGTNVIVPPIGFLDNYTRPAKRENLYLWLHDNLRNHDYAVISADMLIHGGLINSRLALGKAEDHNHFLSTLQNTAVYAPHTECSVFSIIPRLLVSDHILPDRWYQWQLMNYAKLKDMTETFNDPYFTQKLLTAESKIPPEVLNKYLSLYKNNDSFNKNLLTLSYSNIYTVIGQDDGSSFGLPNRNTNHAKMYAHELKNAHITYGADEIAAVIIARNYLQSRQAVPKIYLHYADPQSEFIYMPFMAASVGETLRDKAALLGAELVDDQQQADIVLYVNCGHDNFYPTQQTVNELRSLLQSSKRLALLDLAANYDTKELLLPLLLADDFPLNKLAAYAGWNTFSNSAGTVLAQAAIFSERCRELPSTQLPALYVQNLSFTCERLLDDYIYQKEYGSELKNLLSLQGYDTYNLSSKEQNFAQNVTQQYMSRKATELLHYNLGRTPFYTDGEQEYYLTGLTADIYFPWNRVFEIGLDVKTAFGFKTKNSV